MRRRRSSSASSETSTWKGRISMVVSTVALMATSSVPQRREGGPQLARKDLGLLPRREVPAPLGFVVVDEVVVRVLHPVARRLKELVREHRVGDRELHV